MRPTWVQVSIRARFTAINGHFRTLDLRFCTSWRPFCVEIELEASFPSGAGSDLSPNPQEMPRHWRLRTPTSPTVSCCGLRREHFDKRKVEFGSCARPYGTCCQHEHACAVANSTSTRACCTASTNSKPISKIANVGPPPKAGWARSRASIALCPVFATNERTRNGSKPQPDKSVSGFQPPDLK